MTGSIGKKTLTITHEHYNLHETFSLTSHGECYMSAGKPRAIDEISPKSSCAKDRV